MTFDQQLGPHRWRYGADGAWTVFDVDARHLNIHGVAHGGVVYTLIDTGMGFLLERHLVPGARTATVTLTIHYLEPVGLGRIRVSIRAVRVGGRVAVLEATVTGRRRQALAQGTSVFSIRRAGGRRA